MGLLDLLGYLGLDSMARSLLEYLGLSTKKAKLMLLGLDNAGKSTLLCRLKGDTLKALAPTQFPHAEEVLVGTVSFTAFDVGGHLIARKVWKDYFPSASCVIFIVDATERERFAEAKQELDGLLSTPELQDLPFVILGNKIDMGRAASEAELTAALGLNHELTGKDPVNRNKLNGRRPVEIFMCSVVKRHGYGEGIRWLSAYL